MLLGLGIDLLSLPRLEALIKRRSARKLAERICSSCELASFIALPSRLEPSTLQAQELRFLASRWAAKEAAYKAMPAWPAGWGWKNLDLSYGARGKPRLVLLPPEGRDAEAVERRRRRDAEATERRGRSEAEAVDGDGGDEGTARVEVAHADTDVALMVTLSHDGDMIVAAVVAHAFPRQVADGV